MTALRLRGATLARLQRELRDRTLRPYREYPTAMAALRRFARKAAATPTDDDGGLLLMLAGRAFAETEAGISADGRGNGGRRRRRIVDDYVRESEAAFFLCSEHGDSAEDHREWQGRMYVADGWESLLTGEDLDEARDYVKTYGTRTVDWLIGPPVYMITRPNCRHYLRAITVAEATRSSVPALIAKYGMSRAVGERRSNQTLPPRKPGTSARAMAGRYRRRLAFHRRMYRETGLDRLKPLMTKDMILIREWLERAAG